MSLPTPASQLIRARQLIAREGGWCTEVAARDAKGLEVEYESPAACQFCGWGAIWRIAGFKHHAQNYLDEAVASLYPGLTMNEVNDTLGLPAVLTCYDKAIAEAGGAQ